MIGRLLCRIGLHRWRRTGTKSLPPLPPQFPTPAFIEFECRHCPKTDWTFHP